MFHRLGFAALLIWMTAGCANRSKTAYIEIENDQSGVGMQAEPVAVDPRVQVLRNEYQRSSFNEGSNIKQKIILKGPVMIVPATQPR